MGECGDESGEARFIMVGVSSRIVGEEVNACIGVILSPAAPFSGETKRVRLPCGPGVPYSRMMKYYRLARLGRWHGLAGARGDEAEGCA